MTRRTCKRHRRHSKLLPSSPAPKPILRLEFWLCTGLCSKRGWHVPRPKMRSVHEATCAPVPMSWCERVPHVKRPLDRLELPQRWQEYDVNAITLRLLDSGRRGLL